MYISNCPAGHPRHHAQTLAEERGSWVVGVCARREKRCSERSKEERKICASLMQKTSQIIRKLIQKGTQNNQK